MRAHPRTWLLFGAFLTLPWGCVGAPAPGTPADGDGPSELTRASRMLADGEYWAATARLRSLASTCEAGADGRRAVLLLATAALDPRNPDASPDRGASLAARYLTLPGINAEDRVTGEGLYLLAYGVGGRVPGTMNGSATAVDSPAGPVTDSLAGVVTDSRAGAVTDSLAGAVTDFSPGAGTDSPAVVTDSTRPSVASRFQRCDDGRVAMDSVDLTRLPSLPDSIFRRLPAVERDSLRARVKVLEAELRRIRLLLQEGILPDTSDPGGGP